jgi:hypothetical protein
VAHTSILYAWYAWVGCAIKKRVRFSSSRVQHMHTHTHTHTHGTRATRARLMTELLVWVIQFDEACEWGQLAIDLCNKHYANSRFADRGQVWEIFYCTLTRTSMRQMY